MTITSTGVQSRLTHCFDPECVDRDGSRSIAEPEQDGDLLYLSCQVCGSEFGWAKVPATQTDCQLGIPEETRRAGSALVQQGTPVSITRKL